MMKTDWPCRVQDGGQTDRQTDTHTYSWQHLHEGAVITWMVQHCSVAAAACSESVLVSTRV